jgi:hypothetical protein
MAPILIHAKHANQGVDRQSLGRLDRAEQFLTVRIASSEMLPSHVRCLI